MRKTVRSEPDPEQRLDELLSERRQEIEAQAARLEETVQDLERREQLLRDSRASLERLLRLGTSDLESRESELVQLLRDVTSREERLRLDEAELARRREELGAVELKRAAAERRERALDERESELAEREARVDGGIPDGHPGPFLAFVPGPGYGLREVLDPLPARGAEVVLDGEAYVVSRSGPSPLPGDARPCAYLVRGPRTGSPSPGSS